MLELFWRRICSIPIKTPFCLVFASNLQNPTTPNPWLWAHATRRLITLNRRRPMLPFPLQCPPAHCYGGRHSYLLHTRSPRSLHYNHHSCRPNDNTPCLKQECIRTPLPLAIECRSRSRGYTARELLDSASNQANRQWLITMWLNRCCLLVFFTKI